MDWTKILNKGGDYAIQAIIITIALVIFGIVTDVSGKRTELSIGEDIRSLREYLEVIETNNSSSIELINGVIKTNKRITDVLTELSGQNRESRDLIIEIRNNNKEHISGIRNVQDSTLESELITDRIQQILNGIEYENNYNRNQE